MGAARLRAACGVGLAVGLGVITRRSLLALRLESRPVLVSPMDSTGSQEVSRDVVSKAECSPEVRRLKIARTPAAHVSRGSLSDLQVESVE